MIGAVAVILAAAAGGADAADQWRWSITPYMWATGISEDLILDGEVVVVGDTEFDDLVDKIVTSMQLHFEGIKDRWGVFADASHVDLRDSQTGEQGLGRLEADIKDTATEAGLIFRPGGSSGRLDLLVGVRILSIIEKYRLELGQIIGPVERRVDEDYLDALIGARWQIPLSDRWAVSLRGDVSAGGTDYTWTAQGLPRTTRDACGGRTPGSGAAPRAAGPTSPPGPLLGEAPVPCLLHRRIGLRALLGFDAGARLHLRPGRRRVVLVGLHSSGRLRAARQT